MSASRLRTLALLAGLLLLPVACEWSGPYGPIEAGPVFLLPAADGPRLVTVTRREKKLRRMWSESIGAEVRDAISLRVVVREELARIAARSQPGVQVIGATETRLWLLDEGVLRGVDAATLERVADADAIGARSPALAAQLPGEAKYLRVALDGRSLELRSRDARDWALDPATLEAAPFEPPAAKPRDLHHIGDRGPFQLGRALSYRDLLFDSGLFGEVWVGVFIEAAAASETRWSGIASTPYAEERRRLYRADSSRLPGPNDEAALGARTPLGDPSEDFLDGALLRDGAAFHALEVADPASFVVVSKTELGAAGRIVLTRVAVTGERLWTRELPLVAVSWFGARAPALVLLGIEHDRHPEPMRAPRIAAVDLRDGSLALAWVGEDD